MTDIPSDDPRAERQYHRYVTNRIPWYVRLIWICFWTFVAWYLLKYQFPALEAELWSTR